MALEWCLQVEEGASTVGDGSPDAELVLLYWRGYPNMKGT